MQNKFLCVHILVPNDLLHQCPGGAKITKLKVVCIIFKTLSFHAQLVVKGLVTEIVLRLCDFYLVGLVLSPVKKKSLNLSQSF